MIISIVGSGGKTTKCKELKNQYLQEGKTVLLTTTTHMLIENETLINPSLEDIEDGIKRNGWVFCGNQENDKKIKSLDAELLEQAMKLADVTIIEADGSKQMPLKYCLVDEPVVHPNSAEVIVIVNLKDLNKPIKEVVHRAKEACDMFSWDLEQNVTASMIQKLLRTCYISRLKNYKITIQVNGANSLYERAVASLLEDDIDVDLIDEKWFMPQPKCVILGGGHVSQAIVKMASILELYTIVIDPREEFANHEVFRLANEVYCNEFDQMDSLLPTQTNTAYIIVTRGHKDDSLCLKKVIYKPHFYVGMIGSKKKVKQTMDTIDIDKELLKEVHAPIGIPIHCETPAEISLSILSQVVDIKNQIYSASISKELLETKKNGVLCLILRKTGSAPRNVGSMMLVTKDRIIDTIGGGTIEHQVIEDAKECKNVKMETYSLNNEEGSKLGMICGGTNTILFIPI